MNAPYQFRWEITVDVVVYAFGDTEEEAEEAAAKSAEELLQAANLNGAAIHGSIDGLPPTEVTPPARSTGEGGTDV